jgi:REP element-mobilizing transposase RayT
MSGFLLSMTGADQTNPNYPNRRKLPHQIPHWVRPSSSAWFITINCEPPGKPQLCSDTRPHSTSAAVLSAARLYHEMKEPKWFIHLFLLMPDHLHAILGFPEGVSLKSTFKAWKGYLKRNHGVIWQNDFFDHRLRDQDSYHQKMHYIRQNPIRKGLCEKPEDWPHSLSFDPFSGKETNF